VNFLVTVSANLQDGINVRLSAAHGARSSLMFTRAVSRFTRPKPAGMLFADFPSGAVQAAVCGPCVRYLCLIPQIVADVQGREDSYPSLYVYIFLWLMQLKLSIVRE
jgi:hypothetical protein